MNKRLDSSHLTPAHRHRLDAWVRAGTTPQRVVRRARIVLLCGTGLSARSVARALGVSPHTVTRWWRRYRSEGPSGLLQDAPGRGRRKTIPAAVASRIRELCKTPAPSGSQWTIRQLAQATGISRASVHRIVSAAPAQRPPRAGRRR